MVYVRHTHINPTTGRLFTITTSPWGVWRFWVERILPQLLRSLLGGLACNTPCSETQLGLCPWDSQVLVSRSCPTLWDPMDCSPSGSSVHGIIHARILEWVVIPFSRGSSSPRDPIQVSCTAAKLFTICAISGFVSLRLTRLQQKKKQFLKNLGELNVYIAPGLNTVGEKKKKKNAVPQSFP